MGQHLSVPATDVETHAGSNNKYTYVVSEMQGWRITMEDAHAADLSLDGSSDEPNAFFAVYDGHGGYLVAHYAGEHVHKRLITEEAYKEKRYPEALKNAFIGSDADMLRIPTFLREPSGCTAVAALVTGDNRIFVANAGDSRSVLSVKGEAKPLSFDHKPVNTSERQRIVSAGGYVEFGRVNGNLALARALGDFEYKKNTSLPAELQIITSDPEVTEHQITEEDEFLILACDGIWDCLSSQQCVDAVRSLIAKGKKLSEIPDIIFEHCMAPGTESGTGIGCDNMTMLIVSLLHGKTEEEWYQWVTDRVNSKYGYDTPMELPDIYPKEKVRAFKELQARRAYYSRLVEEKKKKEKLAEEERARAEKEREDRMADERERDARLAVESAERTLEDISDDGATGIGIRGDSGAKLMFDNSDDDSNGSDDNDDDNDMDTSVKAFPKSSASDSVTQNLKKQLDDLEKEDETGANGDGDAQTGKIADEGLASQAPEGQEPTKTTQLQGEAPPPPKTFPNGDAKVKQLESKPGGDAPSDAVRAEGLADSSESPFKV